MVSIQEGDLLWKPTEKEKHNTNIYQYMNWLSKQRGISFSTYEQLWKWSVSEVESFWESLWEYFNIESTSSYTEVISSLKMPKAQWFQGATVNYTEHVFRNRTEARPAIIAKSEIRPLHEISWKQLYDDVASFAHGLKKLGVKRGDRIVAYIPNIEEAIVAFLASASLGAIWSSCSPDFGAMAVIDRFKQIEPKIMITVDGYRYNGKDYVLDRTIDEITERIDSIEHTIMIPYLEEELANSKLDHVIDWKAFMLDHAGVSLQYERLPFDHPIWVLFSSGTTGLPKAIVHGQGGIILEHLKYFQFHADAKENDRFFWYTTTGWMMWNVVVGALLNGNTTIVYDGSPVYPSIDSLWEFIEETKMTTFGTSANYILRCMNEKVSPISKFNLEALRSIFVTASPLRPEGFQWVYNNVKNNIWLGSMSGGTDVCTAFVLHSPLHDVRAGYIQTRALGANVQAYDELGNSLIGEVGELVLTTPMPSMPLYFWNDKNDETYLNSYFHMYPNIWRHGDWIKINKDGTNQIYGRSDSTINRGGIRIGTSEIYRAIEILDEIDDSMIVDVHFLDGRSFMPLFVKLNSKFVLDETLKEKINKRIREYCSPRHVPNEIYEIVDIPYTLNDKKMEVPIKRILMGVDPNKSINIGAMKNPQLIDYFMEFKEKVLS